MFLGNIFLNSVTYLILYVRVLEQFGVVAVM